MGIQELAALKNIPLATLRAAQLLRAWCHITPGLWIQSLYGLFALGLDFTIIVDPFELRIFSDLAINC